MVCSTSRRFLSGGLRRQIDCRVVSAEPRRDSFFFSELNCSEDSLLGGGSVCGDFPTGYYGESQCASGRPFSPKPGLGLRVDAEAGGLQGFVQEVAGVTRPVCNVSKSQLFLIFFSLPQSQCYGDGCASSKLKWVAGVCFSSLVSHSGGFEEAPVVLWSSTDHRGSILVSEAVVCSDRILTCRIKSIRSPAKVGLVVTDLITSPVVSWEGWETPPPAPRLCCHSLLNHRRGKTSLLLW